MERPIKGRGKYNLNFIDWNNEYDRIASSNYNWNPDDNNCNYFI
jgi:hypothetical protein